MTKSTITRERLLEIIVTGPEASGAEQNELARMALAAMDGEPVAIIDQANLDYLRSGADADVWPPEREEMGDVLLYRHAQPAPELKPVGYLFVSDQGAIAYSPTDWGVPGFRLAGQIFGDIDVELKPAPVVPDGYVMVPKEPTGEMIHAGHLYFQRSMEMCDDFTPSGMFNSMLAAAPQSPGSEPATVPGEWIPVSEQMPPSRHEVLVGRWWGEKPRWCCKWATYIPGHPDAQSSGWLIPGASWTPTHWMPLPTAPQEPKP